ncbi:MAG: cytochrome b/b6 domain-containing protein, partial [Silvanigrellaceae bacterium]|nr:cytochrome b/b6 domain-containing protein [Silvanigrellaceae bacterium]
MNKTTMTDRYPSGFKWLHWLIALTLLIMLSATFFFEDLPKSAQGVAFMVHKSIGLTILLAMIIRFIWISIVGRPALPLDMPAWQKFMAKLVQTAL